MADHAHKQIRAAVVAAVTGLTTSGSRVYANRLYPLTEANLPGLRVFMDQEDAQAQSIHAPHLQERTARLVVECCAKATSALDDTLDLMSKEVEVALAAALTVGGKSVQLIYSGMEFDDEISNQPAGMKRLSFDCQFYTQNNAPDILV